MCVILETVKGVKIFLLVSSIICLYFSYYFYKFSYDRYTVKREGNLVSVELVYVPNLCEYSTNLRFKFIYQKKIIKMRIGGKVCNYKKGDKINLYYSQKYQDVFVFPEDNVEKDFIVPIFMLVFGLFCIIFVLSGRVEREMKGK